MNLLKIVSFLLFHFGIALCSRVSYDGYKLWSVEPKTLEQTDKIASWRNEDGIDFWSELTKKMDPVSIVVAPHRQKAFEDFLSHESLEHRIIVENLERVFAEERVQQKIGKEKLARTGFQLGELQQYHHFWSIDEINQYIDYLLRFYGHIATEEKLGRSLEGRPLRAIKISLHGKVDGSRPIIFIDAGIHAREWAAHMTAVHLLRRLIEHSNEHLDVLEDIDWIIIPVVNPDGYVYSHNKDRMWRKNRRRFNGTQCVGVDNNRNYGYKWLARSDLCNPTSSGAYPFSEPETRAVRTIIQKYRPNIKLYASLHSYGGYVLYPWGYDDVNIDNWEEHQTIGDKFKAAVYAKNQIKYQVGNSAVLLYPAAGGSDDYAAFAGVDYAFTVELRAGGGNIGFVLLTSEIDATVDETFEGILEFGKYIKNH